MTSVAHGLHVVHCARTILDLFVMPEKECEGGCAHGAPRRPQKQPFLAGNLPIPFGSIPWPTKLMLLGWYIRLSVLLSTIQRTNGFENKPSTNAFIALWLLCYMPFQMCRCSLWPTIGHIQHPFRIKTCTVKKLNFAFVGISKFTWIGLLNLQISTIDPTKSTDIHKNHPANQHFSGAALGRPHATAFNGMLDRALGLVEGPRGHLTTSALKLHVGYHQYAHRNRCFHVQIYIYIYYIETYLYIKWNNILWESIRCIFMLYIIS